jgi:hypothetical protein
MTVFKTAIAIAVGSLFAGAAFAQSNSSIEQRDRAEDARIERGVESGQLTRREAAGLESERAQIERMERRARSDGVMTQNERNRIDRAQDRLSRDIYRESHDSQTRQTNWRNSERPQGWDRRNGNDQRHFDHGFRPGQVDHRAAVRNESHANNTATHTGTGHGTWARPAQTSTPATSTGTTGTAGTARPARTTSTAGRVTVARAGGYSGRYTR